MSLPSADGSLIAEIQGIGLSPAPFERNTEIGGFTQAVSLVFRLLDSFNSNDEMQSRAKHHDFILRQNFSWLLNGFHRLRQPILEWLQWKGLHLTSEDEEIPLQYLKYVRRCYRPDSTVAGLLSNITLTSTWSQCLCAFLKLANIERMPSVQTVLSHFLDDLAQTSTSSGPLIQQLRETLLPALIDAKSCDQRLESCLLVNFVFNISGSYS